MYKTLLALVLTFNFAATADLLADHSGQIAQVVTGEFDPYIVGDACVVLLKTDAKTIGLLTDFDACEDYAEELSVGRGLTVVVEAQEKVTKTETLEILKGVVVADEYFKVDFGTIENGLAD